MLIGPGERTGKFRLGGHSLIEDEEGNSPLVAIVAASEFARLKNGPLTAAARSRCHYRSISKSSSQVSCTRISGSAARSSSTGVKPVATPTA
jgi:hypothetical protein